MGQNLSVNSGIPCRSVRTCLSEHFALWRSSYRVAKRTRRPPTRKRTCSRKPGSSLLRPDTRRRSRVCRTRRSPVPKRLQSRSRNGALAMRVRQACSARQAGMERGGRGETTRVPHSSSATCARSQIGNIITTPALIAACAARAAPGNGRRRTCGRCCCSPFVLACSRADPGISREKAEAVLRSQPPGAAFS